MAFMAALPYLIAAGGTILGSSMQAKAAGNAADDQLQGQKNALNLQMGQYNQIQQMLSPYREAGYNALNALLSMDRLPLDKTPYQQFVPLTTAGDNFTPAGVARTGRGRGADPAGLVDNKTANTLGKIGDPANLLGGFFAKGGIARGGHTGKAFVVGEPDPKTGKARPEILHMAPGSVGYVQPNPATPGAHIPHRMLGGPVDGGEQSDRQENALVAPRNPQTGTAATAIGDPVHGNSPAAPKPETAQPYNFRADPGYKFAFNEGLRALDDNNAANGLLHSTAETRMATRYGQGMADQEYNDIYNRILAISGLGTGANSTGAQFSLGAGQGIANTFGNIGNAGASGAINAGNIDANALNSLGSLYAMYANRPQTPPPTVSSGRATVVP